KGMRRAAGQSQSVKKAEKAAMKAADNPPKPHTMHKGQKHVIDALRKHGHLPEWAGASCPHCTNGTLGKLNKWSDKQGGWSHRRNHSGCHRRVLPRAFHPIFVAGTGQSHAPPRDQAPALFLSVAGASQVRIGRLAQKNHKMDGGPSPVDWEQRGGIVEKSAPDALVLFRLEPAKTRKRAPGPGATRKRDWMPAAKEWLKGRRVILHADGAPKKKLWVMAGAQVIDNCWHGLRKHLGSVKVVNTKLLRQKTHSFQWEYWNRGADYWQRTGDMLSDLWHKAYARSIFLASPAMAGAPAGQVPSLGQLAYDAAGDGKLTVEEASLMASGGKLDDHPSKCVRKDRLSSAGDLSMLNPPLVPIAHSSTAKLIAFADVASNYGGPIDFDRVHELRCNGNFKGLQGPLSLKKEPAIPHTTQLFIMRDNPADSECSTHRILKIVSFEKNTRDRLKVTADVPKAFLNPKEEDALLRARWGGCGFEQRSRRRAAANTCDRDAERAALDAVTRNKYDLDRVKKIVAPSLEEAKTEEDFNAILARSHFVVVTDPGVPWRAASADLEGGAEFTPWPNPRAPDLFASEVRDTSSPAVRPLPSDYADKMEWSTGCMSSLAEGRDVPTVATIRIAPMFGDDLARAVSVVGSMSGFVEPGAAASASSAPAAASASRSDGAADAPAAAVSASHPDDAADAPYEGDAFGLGGGMDGPEESAPAASAAQPDIVGRCGELTKEDQDEQIAIFKSLARARHGACEDLCSPPPVKRAKRPMVGCGGPLSRVDAAEQEAIFASIVASARRGAIAVDGDDDNDGALEAELGRLIEQGDQASGPAAAPPTDAESPRWETMGNPEHGAEQCDRKLENNRARKARVKKDKAKAAKHKLKMRFQRPLLKKIADLEEQAADNWELAEKRARSNKQLRERARKQTRELAESNAAEENAQAKGAADAKALKAWKSWFEAFSRARDQELPPKATKLLRDWATWPFPLRKRGKDRMGQRRKQAEKVECARHGKKTVKSRKERETWRRNYDSFHGKTADQMVDLLLEDGVLLDWEGRTCPHCGVGTCGARVHDDNRGPHWRCNGGRLRGKTVDPCTAHPVFKSGGGCQSSSLSTKAKVLVCLTLGMTTAQIHLLTGANHKMIEDMSAAAAAARQIYVEKNEPNIVFGDEAQRRWFDVEADESVFRAQLSDDGRSKTREQWAGVVERGRPDSLVLWKTQSDGTEANAPGSGAIKKTDWAPFLKSRLENRKVILHSDGARSYKMRASGLVRDHVVHCKKRKKIGRKWVWLKPVYSKVVTHKLPDGSKIRVKTGAQIIDRAWRSIKTLIGTRTDLPGSRRLAASVRSAQFEYWNKGKDMWAATADAIWEVMDA
ncbi:unnamed protein product, partial [Prorocentrum cordatum]